MKESFLTNLAELKSTFSCCTSAEAKYKKIIELGQHLPPFNPEAKVSANLVHGCQSVMYLETISKDGRVFFNADSEALISRGLAALLIKAYSGQLAEIILKCPPDFLAELGIQNSLSPSRSNGLASLYLKMQQDSLQSLR